MSSSSEAEFEEGEEIEEGEEVENAEPESPAPPSRRAKRQINYTEDDLEASGDYDEDEDEADSSDDDDDDIPLSQLAAKKKKAQTPPAKKKRATTNGQTKTSSAKKKTTAKKTTSASTSTSASSGNKSYEYASAALYGTECDKGLLIQRLLCRWWYAFEWPVLSQENLHPPAGYDALDGFPGVFVGTSGDTVGQILDTRDHATKPSFHNFAAKSAKELKDLLLAAIERQKEILEAQPPGESTDSTLKELTALRKWANKLNCDKADKEAAKVLKAHKLTLV